MPFSHSVIHTQKQLQILKNKGGKTMKNYMKEFVTEDSGMELLQEAIIVVIAVSLIAVVMKLRDAVGKKIEATSSYVDTNLTIENNSGGAAK